VIITVPADTPVTTPLAFTVAMLVLLLLHEPPAVPLLVNVLVDPTHTDDPPLIEPAFGAALTVIDFVAEAEPQPLVTV
jgi:hypothetical protein